MTCTTDSFGVNCDGSTAATAFSVTSTGTLGGVEEVDVTGSGDAGEVGGFLLKYCQRLLGTAEGTSIASWVAANADASVADVVIAPIAVTYRGPLSNAWLQLSAA